MLFVSLHCCFFFPFFQSAFRDERVGVYVIAGTVSSFIRRIWLSGFVFLLFFFLPRCLFFHSLWNLLVFFSVPSTQLFSRFGGVKRVFLPESASLAVAGRWPARTPAYDDDAASLSGVDFEGDDGVGGELAGVMVGTRPRDEVNTPRTHSFHAGMSRERESHCLYRSGVDMEKKIYELSLSDQRFVCASECLVKL